VCAQLIGQLTFEAQRLAITLYLVFWLVKPPRIRK